MSYEYNRVHVHLLKTVQFEAVQERDPTNTDALYMKYTIRVRGFLSQTRSVFNGNLAGAQVTSAAVLAAVKAQLETPRRPFLYKIGDVTLVSVPGGLDAKLGPEPLPCSVREVTTGVFMVECGVVVRLVECPTECPTGQVRSPVLSLRWTQTESFDENWYSRLDTRGRLIVRSDMLKNADSFRALTVPPVAADYRRTSSSYTLSPDGLELEFEYSDVEEDRLPPFPATVFEGSYTVRIERPGFKRFGTVQIGLEGQKGTSRKTLLLRAINMAYTKLEADGFHKDPAKPGPPIVWGEFREDLRHPKVQVSMTGLMSNLATGAPAAGGFGERLGRFLLLSGVLSPAAGFADLALTAAKEGRLAEFLTLTVGISPSAAVLSEIIGGAPPGGGLVAGAADAVGVPAVPGGAGVGAFFTAAVASAVAKLDSEAAPKVMPSVGIGVPDLTSNRPGIAPPDRKRISALLVAMFRDPCLCAEPEAKDKTTASPSVFSGSLPSLIVAGAPAAKITVAPLPPVTPDAVIKDDAVYDTFEMDVTTTFEEGVVLMPGTGVGTAGRVAAAVSACGPVMKRLVSWVAGRTGKPPVLPAYEPTDPNLVALGGNVVAQDVKTSADGGDVQYLVAGYYIYGVLDPTKYQMVPGVAPFYGTAIDGAAAEAFKFWEAPLKQSTAQGLAGSASGTNPFVEDGIREGLVPTAPPGFQDQVLAPAVVAPQLSLTAPGGNNYQGVFYAPPNRP